MLGFLRFPVLVHFLTCLEASLGDLSLPDSPVREYPSPGRVKVANPGSAPEKPQNGAEIEVIRN